MGPIILLVDDDEVLARVLGRVLTREGYRVILAGDKARALELGRQHHPELVILDLCLPDGAGTELALQLHAEQPQLPLILMTAYPVQLRDDPSSASLFVHTLTKPLDLYRLRQVIGALLPLSGDARGVHSPLVAAFPS
jgi:DNA-binding response OmpR family regulator